MTYYMRFVLPALKYRSEEFGKQLRIRDYSRRPFLAARAEATGGFNAEMRSTGTGNGSGGRITPRSAPDMSVRLLTWHRDMHIYKPESTSSLCPELRSRGVEVVCLTSRYPIVSYVILNFCWYCRIIGWETLFPS